MQGCIRRVCTEFCKDAKQYKHTQTLTLRMERRIYSFGGVCGSGDNRGGGRGKPGVRCFGSDSGGFCGASVKLQENKRGRG